MMLKTPVTIQTMMILWIVKISFHESVNTPLNVCYSFFIIVIYIFWNVTCSVFVAAKEFEVLEMCTSAKIKRTCEMVFEQLEAVRAKLAQSQQELEEVQSVSVFSDFLPDKVEKVFNNQHSWSMANVKCDDQPLFDGDPFAELKVWLDKQASEPQETHVPVSDTSKFL